MRSAVDAWDVVVAGAGVAGVSVAAALREFGHRVLLVEPGLDSAKRLAGELIHPPGASTPFIKPFPSGSRGRRWSSLQIIGSFDEFT